MKFEEEHVVETCRELEEGIGEYIWSYFIVYNYEILKQKKGEKRKKTVIS